MMFLQRFSPWRGKILRRLLALVSLHLLVPSGAVWESLHTALAGDTDYCLQARQSLVQALRLYSAPNSQSLDMLLAQEQLYHQAIALCPDAAEAHNNLGNVYENLGRYADAIRAYKDAIQAQAHFVLAYYGLGDVYLKQGNYDAAITWYTAGLQQDGESSDAQTVSRTLLRQAHLLHHTIIKQGRAVVSAEAMQAALSRPTVRGPSDVVKITLGENLVPFGPGQRTLREEAKTQLDQLGKALTAAALAGDIFEIAGHTDSFGPATANLTLSLRRAEAVRDYLLEHFHLPQERLRVRGYGEYRPLALGTDAASQALNRRVEISRIEASAQPVKLPHDQRRIGLQAGVLFAESMAGPWQSLRADGSTVLRPHVDRYQIFFQPQQTCYVYVLQRETTEQWTMLFPPPETVSGHTNPIQENTPYWLPAFGQGLLLDGPPGQTTIYVIASPQPAPTLASQSSQPQAVDILLTRGIMDIVPLVKEPVNPFGVVTQVVNLGGVVWSISFLQQ